jgi:hypothetical protein
VLSFTDCASRYCTVHYLKSRTEVYEKLKGYIVWVKTLSNISDATIAYSIKIIQAYKAAEYERKERHKICADNGIHTKYASPTLHENAAVAERVWETIQDARRVVMYTAKFMKSEWLLAFSRATYIYN